MLKELTWEYVIHNHHLALQQFGQRKVIRTLFEVFIGAAEQDGGERLFPLEYQEQLIESADQNERVLLAIDFIASMTEQQALEV